MSPDQWISVATNAGIGLVALLVVVFVIVPMFRDDSKATRDTIEKGALATAAAVDRNTAALERNTTATGALGERIARMEGVVGSRPATAPPALRVADGSRDMTETAAAVRGGGGS